MKKILKFLAVLAGIVLLSAVLAPVLFDFLPFKFERIFNRLIMIFSLVAVVCFVRIRRDMLNNYGLAWRTNSLSMFLFSFLSGFVILSGLCAVYVLTGYAVWRPAALGITGWLARFAGALTTGLVVGLLEEFFFRGFCYRTVLGSLSGSPTGKTPVRGTVWASIFLTSLFYSLVHFVNHKKPLIGPDPGFTDSLKLVLAPFASLADWGTLWPQVLGLLFFGMILNRLVVKTNSLYPAAGLHAGCVFYIKLNGALVDFSNNRNLMAGSSKLYDGVVGWVVLILLGYALEGCLSRIHQEKSP